MTTFYSNITLADRTQEEVLAYLNDVRESAYVCAPVRGAVVIFQEDLSTQEELAQRLSHHFGCAALLVMGYGQRVLLYQLNEAGERTHAYVSSPHDELEIGDDSATQGNATMLCAAFGAERNERRVEAILRKESKEGQAYEYAINRHGELFRALGLPMFAAGASFAAIELGEPPAGQDFDLGGMVKTPR